MGAKKILIAEWAKRHYDPPPSDWVLRKWARNGEVLGAEKVGHDWYVPENTQRVVPGAAAQGKSLVEQMGG